VLQSLNPNKEKKMGIISWILMGLIVGALAKFIMPGDDPGGIVVTILLGIAGAFLGGFIGSRLGLGDVTGFNLGSLVLAVGGALVLLFGYRILRKNKG
jgi:uncharacterized membrane protein YeaQ/YmgE (transglycosylase-associated protein family)